ncbi:Sec-independent protein translocase protein TatB [Asticcacaulis aquaticus]|uniref:Sec-independent protein translocase protein TatB n=1 Tax=Asticcacaulis aquaticus TaxID=2984212 RepID=UPI0034A40C24
MLPGIGGSELILIAVVALIVVGPKDLPKLLRQLGKFVAKMRSMADEFRTSFDDMARQSELDDLRKEVEALRSGQISSPVIDDIREDMRRIEGEIDETLQPKGHYYSGSDDVPSPDSNDFSDDYGQPSVTDAPVAETPAPVKKPRKPRAKAVEAAPVVEDAVKPKRTRAKKVAS